MAVGGVRVATASSRVGLGGRAREFFDREGVLGPLFVTPALIILVLLVAYPFAMALYFSLSNAFIGRPSHLVGFRNFINLWDSDAFRQTFQNAFVFTGVAVAFKVVLGLSLALLLNQQLWFKRLIRGVVLLLRHASAPQGSAGHRRALLDDLHVRRLQHRVRARAWGPDQLCAPFRRARPPDRSGDRAHRRGSGELALPLPRTGDGGVG